MTNSRFRSAIYTSILSKMIGDVMPKSLTFQIQRLNNNMIMFQSNFFKIFSINEILKDINFYYGIDNSLQITNKNCEKLVNNILQYDFKNCLDQNHNSACIKNPEFIKINIKFYNFANMIESCCILFVKQEQLVEKTDDLALDSINLAERYGRNLDNYSNQYLFGLFIHRLIGENNYRLIKRFYYESIESLSHINFKYVDSYNVAYDKFTQLELALFILKILNYKQNQDIHLDIELLQYE